ncbi:MAG TPA: hypothetical protein ENH87_02105 [Pricia antarctica]|uniref:Uncharacterized protein n=1 Tax=Pricia antarctica TaxID=641691 RepID=A0A831VLH6_9FLAO|nr:hypothetical protein [Pricia antarctica]
MDKAIKSKKQALMALRISKNPQNDIVEMIDKRLLDRAMELHREIKELSARLLKLQQEKIELLEENRLLRIKLDELEKGVLNDYQDH